MTIFLSPKIYKTENLGNTGFYYFWGFGGFVGFGRFRVFRGLARSGVFRGGSQFRPDLGIWPDLPNLGFFRGPESGVSGVQIWPFSGSQIRGKSTLSATMVSVVSSSTDPDFGRFFQILTKSGVPGQKNLGFPGSKIWVFRGPKSGFLGVRKRVFLGPGPDSGISGFWPDFGFSGFWPDFGFLGTLGPKIEILGVCNGFGWFSFVWIKSAVDFNTGLTDPEKPPTPPPTFIILQHVPAYILPLPPL